MITCFPDPYPDEILYSVWARYGDHVQYQGKRKIFQELFGNEGGVAMIDLPCYLGYFVDHLPPGTNYTVDWLIDHHTLFPFYSPFLSQDRRRRVREQMISSNATSINSLAGKSSSKIPSPSSFRYCLQCLEEDREKFGEGYWHRLHQISGVEICPVHMAFLEHSSISLRSGISLTNFVSIEYATLLITKHEIDKNLCRELIEIARDIRYLLDHPNTEAEPELLREQYFRLLADQGFLTSGDKVRTTKLMSAFLDYYSPELLKLLHCNLQPSKGKRSITWLSQFMMRSQIIHPPLHHILLMHFLKSKVEVFLTNPLQLYAAFGSGPWPCLNPACEFFQQLHIDTYRISRSTHRGQMIGIFSCSCGFIYSRWGPARIYEDAFKIGKIISFGPIWQNKLHELWSDSGIQIKQIAAYLGTNITTIKAHARILQLPTPRASIWSSVPARSHKPKGNAKSKVWYRERWLELLEEYPEDNTSTLSNKSFGVHQWLRKHDREWLESHCPLPRQPRRLNYDSDRQTILQSLQESEISEDAERIDAQTAESVRFTVRYIANQTAPLRRITLRGILKEIPIVAKLRHNPESAPLTVQALEEALETREAFALRRLQEVVQEYQQQSIFPTRSQIIYKAWLWKYLDTPLIHQALEEAVVMLWQPVI